MTVNLAPKPAFARVCPRCHDWKTIVKQDNTLAPCPVCQNKSDKN